MSTITDQPTSEGTAPRPWYRKKRYVIPLGLLALVFAGNALGGGGEQPTSQPAESAPAAEAAGVGQAVQDGKFEFVLQGVECGATSVGEEFLSEKAQGQFCLVALRVANVGTEPQFMFTDNQYLFDEAGRKFAADSAATLVNNPENDVWISEVNPGNTVEGVLVFDVPADARLARAELHDSAFSGGAVVNLP